ncbi:glycosyltransferase family 2 protein [Catalinimonas sp. 4WD22]|uniref:glycosyltransferase family 2 protein n=1 Tax=Catalinimonas locisalis TaxID=3133978 RepID=UPI003101259B
MNPLVSVILPNYNHRRYLPKRIESIFDQTFRDFELIILDDCSTDQSQEFIKEYAQRDARVKTYFNKKNSGSTFRQWNKGVELAKGKFIWIAESDDWADITFLEKLIKSINKGENIGIAYSQSYEINESDEVIASRIEWTNDLSNHKKWVEDYWNLGVNEINENLCLKNTIPNVSAALIRRDAYISVGEADNSMKYAGDWELYIKILMQFNIAFVSEPLNYNRRHDQSQRVKNTYTKLAVKEILMILDKIEPILKESNKREAYKLLSKRWASSLYHDASTYTIKEMWAFSKALRLSLGKERNNLFPLMIRRILFFDKLLNYLKPSSV